MNVPISVQDVAVTPDTSISNSCNCFNRCTITCCFPWRGRKVKHLKNCENKTKGEAHKRLSHSEP